MSRRAYIIVTAVLFLVITIVHLLRVVLGWQIEIDGVNIPYWVSELAIFVTGALSYIGFSVKDDEE